MSFSDRYCPSPMINYKVIPDTLKTRIWNVFYKTYYKEGNFKEGFYPSFFDYLIDNLREEIFIETTDIKTWREGQLNLLKEKYCKFDYLKFYGFIEYIASFEVNFGYDNSNVNIYTKSKHHGINSAYKARFIERCNDALEKEKAQFRLVNCLVTPITNQEEIDEIEKAAKTTEAGQHINTAIQLYKNRENPDYRNSIKESISAVEATYRQVTGKQHSNISDAITEMEKIGMKLPESLKKGFTAIYGWTSGPGGYRHALMKDECNLTEAEARARLMLVMCSAYVNYLLSLKDRASNK